MLNISVYTVYSSLLLPMQSVPITTNRCEFESRSGEVYSIQHYVIKYVSDLRQVSGFLRFSSPIKLTVMIELKYC